MSVVRAKGQLTIPAKVRRAAHLKEGDPVDLQLTPEGILLRPHKMVDATEAWFWTPDWQAGEREASAQIAAGKVEHFPNDQSFLRALKRRR
jgi:AbrB family looped-hinge helix DNA binding protein